MVDNSYTRNKCSQMYGQIGKWEERFSSGKSAVLQTSLQYNTKQRMGLRLKHRRRMKKGLAIGAGHN